MNTRTEVRGHRRHAAGWLTWSCRGTSGLSGCGQSDRLPKLQVYEVTGKVVLADGKPLSSGCDLVRPERRPADHSQREDRPGRNILAGHGWVGRGSTGGRIQGSHRSARSSSRTRSPRNRFSRSSTPTKTARDIVVTVLPQANQLDPIVLK